MSDDKNLNNEDLDNNTKDDDELDASKLDAQTKAIYEKMVEEQLKEIKGKLNKSFEERDKAVKEAARVKEEMRKKEIEALEAAGKTEEALKAKLADMEAELESLRSTNTALTRNQRLEAALNSIDGRAFRNARSRDLAFREIVDQLVQKEDGSWVHRTGITIEDYVKVFASDSEYEFLFKPLENRGAGGPGKSGIPDSGLDLSQGVRKVPLDKFMQTIEAGKYGRKKSF